MLMGLLLLTLPAFSNDSKTVLNYYYIPFQIETYEPITLQNIKDKATVKGVVMDDDALTLLRLLADKKQVATFDKKRVRLLVETKDGKNPIFVDAEATVFNGESEYALNPKAFTALKKCLRG